MQDRIYKAIPSLISHTYFPVVILILVNLVISIWIVRDFGESWDERPRLQYARRSLEAYSGDLQALEDEKGSSYVIIAELGSEILSRIIPNWSTIDAWHFMNFLSFQAALFFLYMLCLRITHKWGAFGATLLFSTQPLLWGHAFINPKDIPFMASFLGAVALGLKMADSLQGVDLTSFWDKTQRWGHAFDTHVSEDWNRARGRKLTTLVITSALTFGLLLGLYFANTFIRDYIVDLVYRVYYSESDTLLTSIFSRIAENMQSLPVENYTTKALNLYARFLSLYTAGTIVVNLLIIGYLFPSTLKDLWSRRLKPFTGLITGYLANKHVLMAGILLGLCTSIRTLGPASGLLIAGYCLIKMGRKALPALVVYFSVASVVTYLTWPGLWDAPLSNFLRSFFEAADFGWDGNVMFQGVEINSGQLPPTYLPVLLSLQFTLTTLILFVVGIFITLIKLYKRQVNKELVFLFAAWLFVPILAVVILRPTMYDNFRHFLFIVPPMFIFVSPAIGMIIDRSSNFLLSAFLLLVLILPGVYWNIALHPYEYVYYNAFTGWTAGAFRQYEMDYWATSYREATLYLNEVAPQNAQVLVWGPDQLVTRYGRLDLNIVQFEDGMAESEIPPDYAIVSTRHNTDELLFRESPTIYQVVRDNAVFAVIKRLR
jgi:hypothetical protein